MQYHHTDAFVLNEVSDSIAYHHAEGEVDFANEILIVTGDLELRPDQDYYYTDDWPSFSEIKKDQASIRQHMIEMKTFPEMVTPERSDAVIRALYGLLRYAIEHIEACQQLPATAAPVE